jgi:hypothetical protein
MCLSALRASNQIDQQLAKATTADDVLDANGNVIKEGTGDLSQLGAFRTISAFD